MTEAEPNEPPWMPKAGDSVVIIFGDGSGIGAGYRPVKVMHALPGWRFLLGDGSDVFLDKHITELQPAGGYSPASRLLAVEAELGRVKAELKRIAESWLSNAGALRIEGARYETYEGLENCADELLRAAPPSPPVASEPAQEAKRAEFMALAKRVGAPGVTVLAGSGEPAQEAGGVERVTAEQAWVLLTSIMARQDNAEQRQQMRRFVAQQEQSEREAAGLREQVEGYRTAWSEACGEREKAKLAAEAAETEAEMRRLFLVTANTDRDAERTQKEALRAELEKQHGYVLQLQESHGRVAAERDAKAELAKEWEALRNNVYRSYREATDERDALRTENEGLKAKLRERDICWHCKDTLLEPDGRPHCENCPAEGDCDDAACSEDGCREERAQQPAEAAPVLSCEDAMDATGDEVERHPIGGHGDRLAGSPHIVDCFSVELGCTIRDCLDCGCLVPGGPTRCKRCANEVKS